LVTLSFNIPTKIVTIDSPDTEADIQDIYNQIKDFEDNPEMMGHPIICTASGKQPVTTTVSVAITLQMENGWKIGFEARAGPSYILCTITGGNMVDSSGSIGAWLNPTAFTTVFGGASSSATLISGGTALTAQQTRDAMKLAPSAGAPAAGSIDEMLEEVWQVETGTWKIVADQMIFYERDGVTEIFRRNLLDVTDNPSTSDATQGVRV
jgi:hypothetical protein